MIVDYIYDAVVKQEDRKKTAYRKKKTKAKGPTASNISACRRLNWYKYKGIVPSGGGDPDPILALKFRDGNRLHEETVALMEESGLEVWGVEQSGTYRNIYVRYDAGIYLRCNDCDKAGICPYYEEGARKKHRVEIKTMNGNNSAIFDELGISAFPSYYSQCQVTAFAEPPMPTIILVKDKDSSKYMEDLIIPDVPHINSLVEARNQFDVDIKKDDPPERPNGYTSQACQGCEYLYRCWFSKLRDYTVNNNRLTDKQSDVIMKTLNKLEEERASYESYLFLLNFLKDYIALIHTEQAANKVKLPDFGINSTFVSYPKSKWDSEFLDSILTDEELDEAKTFSQIEFFRTIIKGHGG